MDGVKLRASKSLAITKQMTPGRGGRDRRTLHQVPRSMKPLARTTPGLRTRVEVWPWS